jgi:hypothetical protein
MITVTITGHHHLPGPCISLLDHDLMTDTPSGRVEIDLVIGCEFLNLLVLCLIGYRVILDIVVEGEDGLARV